MEIRDRMFNVGLLAAALVSWALVALVVTTRDPIADPTAGFVGAGLIGLASGLTVAPMAWLAVFAAHRQISYTGDWARAMRRGAWAGLVVGLFVALRVQGVFSPPIALFVLAMVLLAEFTLSAER